MAKKKNENILDNVVKTIEKNNLFAVNKTPLLLMVSGGADSVALSYLIDSLYDNKENIAIMHLNHSLRGKDADSDEKFVVELGKFLNIKTYTYKKDIKQLSKINKVSNIEACGRQVRYKLANKTLEKFADRLNIDKSKIKICTAHNANDRVESFIMKTIKGTGPQNLRGMSYSTKNIVRPLLDIERNDILQYINNLNNKFKDAEGIYWHEDQTNKDTSKFRAYVRHKIVPMAAKCNQSFIHNLCSTMNLLSDESDFIEKFANKAMQEHVKFYNNKVVISPSFYMEDIVIQKRCIYSILRMLFPEDARINNQTIEQILTACNNNNYTVNIQYNFCAHSNKFGVTIQTMEKYRKSRNRI